MRLNLASGCKLSIENALSVIYITDRTKFMDYVDTVLEESFLILDKRGN